MIVNEEFMKKNPQISQEIHNFDNSNNRLILQKEQSSVSFDNNPRFDNNNIFEQLSLNKVESKTFGSFLDVPETHYPGISLPF